MKDLIASIRRATTKLEFELMEIEPDQATVSATLTIIGEAIARIGNKVEGTE